MPTYVLAHIHHTTIGPDIVDYVEHIEATMAPFGGRHIVHGGLTTVLEGEWPGDTVILEFPDRAERRGAGTPRMPTGASSRSGRPTPRAR